jgi:dipeptidyl-peptidase-4
VPDTHSLWGVENGSVYLYSAQELSQKRKILDSLQIRAAGLTSKVERLVWSKDKHQVLVYTNSSRVWREKTKGDYWIFDLGSGKGRQVGKQHPASSLMFAKFAPDGRSVAYVSRHNIYLEDLSTGRTTQLTKDGTARIINGTFDWAYEEELASRDGFRWSPDGKSIAFWRVDATRIPNHLMINNTDSLYPYVIPVEYPKAGFSPSAAKIGVINLATLKTTWMQVPGDPQNHYLPRMDWQDGNSLTVLQLNRRQNEARLLRCNAQTGKTDLIYTDKDEAWIEPLKPFVWDANPWTWIEEGKTFLWSSEKDGWLHIYKVTLSGSAEQLLTRGNYDADFVAYDKTTGRVYFMASPRDATQRYLYYVGENNPDTVRVTPALFEGTNYYRLSPDAQYAVHINAGIQRAYNERLIQLGGHRKVYPTGADSFSAPQNNYTLEKIRVTTADSISLDGIMAKPKNFDATKRYPVLYFVYGEPVMTVANDLPDFDYHIGQLIPYGYVGIALDNRGTPALKGRQWRKSIYKKMGSLNSYDQAQAAREIRKWSFVDSTRIAVFGWSGGGNTTLNLMFRYPDLYQTGVAVASVTDQRFYDNIYTERYMGLPQENEKEYWEASPANFAKNLKGNLLYMHGTGDDNVHYKNAEHLINELVKHQKLFTLMVYPNRSHGIFEGEGTTEHLTATLMQFIKSHTPPGGR